MKRAKTNANREPLAVAVEPLVRQWEFERDLVQGRSIRARWADMRYIFGHREDEPHAATRARNSIRECGPKTRERWGREYRCEQKITRIMSNAEHDTRRE